MPMPPLRLTFALAALLLPAAPSRDVAADLVPLDDAVVIGQPPDTDYALFAPDVAPLPGGFVVAWRSSFARYGGSVLGDRGSGITGRKVAADGQPSGAEIPLVPVTRFTAKGWPRVAANAAGAFVVTWAGASEDDPRRLGVTQSFRRFTAAGQARPAVLLDHGASWNFEAVQSAVSLDAAGRAFAVWSRPRPPLQLGLLGLFAPDERPLSARFWVSLRPAPYQTHPDLALDGRGQAVLAYQSFDARGLSTLYLRRYDAAGRLRGGDVRLAPTSLLAGQYDPALAVHRDGSGVVVWEDASAIRAQRFTPALQPLGAPIEVATGTATIGFPDVAADAQGRFVVTWFETDLEDLDPQFRARGFAADGTPLGAALRVSAENEIRENNRDIRPAVAAGADGTFLIVWAQTPYFYGNIVARLYAVR